MIEFEISILVHNVQCVDITCLWENENKLFIGNRLNDCCYYCCYWRMEKQQL